MAESCIPIMLVTANVGSIFEDPAQMLKIWVNEFLTMVKNVKPQFLALHCQEIGGKNYEESMKHVEEFVRMLMANVEVMQFDRVRIFLDEDFSSIEKFTALGSFYFVHEAVNSVQIWDFKGSTFVPVIGKEVHSGNIENVTTKEKSKFGPEFFPDCKSSRKGFLRTRWSLNGTVFDLINIHLFHDASNFIAMETFPSLYSEYRRSALVHMLDRIRDDPYEKVPFFVFGDFNFRLNTQGVISKLTARTIPHYVKSKKDGETNRILYTETDNENKVILALGKKEFDHHAQQEIFSINSCKWLREYDLELKPLMDRLFEYEITFPPSYPFAENINFGTSYMKTRCPAWCDRILLSKNALPLIYSNPDDLHNSQVRYHVIGQDLCMGDHKPVCLLFRLVWNPGTGANSCFYNNGLSVEDVCLNSDNPSVPVTNPLPVSTAPVASHPATCTTAGVTAQAGETLGFGNSQSCSGETNVPNVLPKDFLTDNYKYCHPPNEEWGFPYTEKSTQLHNLNLTENKLTNSTHENDVNSLCCCKCTLF